MDWAERMNRRADVLTPEGAELSVKGWRELILRRDEGESLPEPFGMDPDSPEGDDECES